MTTIDIQNDVTGAGEFVKGSDGRMNVSSRTDERIYYNARDNEDTYIWTSTDSGAAVGEYIIYIKNTSTTKQLVIKEIVLTPGVAMTFIIGTATGTPTSASITGFNTNLSSTKIAPATAHGDALVDNVTPVQTLRTVSVEALTSEHVDFHDTLRMGQNDIIAIEGDVNAGGTLACQILGYFE